MPDDELVIDNLVFRRHPDGSWEHRIGDIWVRTSGYRDDLFLDEIARLRAKNDVIVTLGNKSQVHVQIDDGKVVHVAWRPHAMATWRPPFTETDNGDADTYTTR